MTDPKPSYRLLLSIVGGVFVLDQLSKWWALAALTRTFSSPNGEDLSFCGKLAAFFTDAHPQVTSPITVLEYFWHFRYAENPGAAWSFMGGAPSHIRLPFLLIFALVASLALVWYYRRAENRRTAVSVALMLGGAAGNFFDRARFGYVIDFIDWHWYDRAAWPTFNVADIAIVFGMGGMILELFRRPQNGDKAAEVSSPTETASEVGSGS